MLRLVTDTERWAAAPGTETTVDVMVRNDSAVPEDISVEPIGARAEWCRLAPASVALAPGGSAVVQLSVVIPPDAPPGPDAQRLLLRARCLSDAAVLALEIRVVPLSAVLDPTHLRTSGTATAELRLLKLPTPGFAAPLRVGLRALADSPSLRVVLPDQVVEVGEHTVVVPVTVHAAGSSHPVGYRIEATAAGHPPVMVEGDVEHTGTPIWLPLIVTVAILVIALGAVLLWGPEITPRPH